MEPGAPTVGELRGRTQRMYDFAELAPLPATSGVAQCPISYYGCEDEKKPVA